MAVNARKRGPVTGAVLLVSAIAWMVLLASLLAEPGGSMGIVHCPVTRSGSSPASLQMLLAMNPIAVLASGWALMLVAMMTPTLVSPIRHVLARSFRKRRARSVGLFAAGYVVIWMGVGMVLIGAELALSLLAPQSWMPAVLVVLIALVWQCSPVKQVCLNRGHNHRELAAFGLAADVDAFQFGLEHGMWCAGSCWAVMLFPMLLPEGHFVAMAGVTFLVVSEGLEAPGPPVWRVRGAGKLWRIVVAQAKLQLTGGRSGSAASSRAA